MTLEAQWAAIAAVLERVGSVDAGCYQLEDAEVVQHGDGLAWFHFPDATFGLLDGGLGVAHYAHPDGIETNVVEYAYRPDGTRIIAPPQPGAESLN